MKLVLWKIKIYLVVFLRLKIKLCIVNFPGRIYMTNVSFFSSFSRLLRFFKSRLYRSVLVVTACLLIGGSLASETLVVGVCRETLQE